MTHDEHGPTPPASGSASNDAASTTGTAGAISTKPARPSRRRHTTSRSRQPKEQKQEQKQAQEHNERPAATEAPAAPAQPAAVAAAPSAEVAPQEPTATAAAETPKRTQTRGRRGGNSRRRGKAESPEVQLVPVVSAPETASAEPSAETTALEYPLEPALPAAEPLPLDAAILAHLDALAEAGAQQEQAAHTEQTEPSPAEAAASVETPSETRRYRFDRPRTQPSTPTTVRAERLSGWRATPPTLMTTPATVEAIPTDEAANAAAEPEPALDAEVVAPADITVDTDETPESAEPQAGEESSVILAGPATDEAQEALVEVPEAEAEDTNEHEGAGRRRRRGRGRGRSGRAHDAESDEVEGDEQQEPTSTRLPAPYTAPETAVTYARDYDQSNGNRRAEAIDRAVEGYEDPSYGYGPYTPVPPATRSRNARANSPATRQQESQAAHWSMADAQQQVQESSSPFGAPEPSFARGFGPQSAGVAAPLHETPTRTRRGERGVEAPPMSANQLGNVITNAITQQTDRLLSELRRQQYPPSMTLALPAFPSTDRIGVFVDVANLLYSARNQRMNIDFGRLLDFLRGNRRLIRAHAYAPTNPDPHAEQTFLAAVKGVGYRITTKNYKTFASGARKADMDLDLCMDIVRMVDAGALDTVVLVSGDSDFLPLLEYCSDHGVRVEVAAFEDAAAMILRQSCDLFINLSQVDEIRA